MNKKLKLVKTSKVCNLALQTGMRAFNTLGKGFDLAML